MLWSTKSSLLINIESHLQKDLKERILSKTNSNQNSSNGKNLSKKQVIN